MFGSFKNQGPNNWFGNDWPPMWFLLACAGVLLVVIWMWVLTHHGGW